MKSSLPPPFFEIGEYPFEDLCCDLLAEEQGITTCDRYGLKGQKQNGIDLLAYRVADGVDVGQCKCYKEFTAAKIREASDEFLKHIVYWRNWSVRRFILFVACDLSNTTLRKEIRKQKRRFELEGIIYEVWSARTIRQKLRPHPSIVANYFDSPEYWVKVICGQQYPTTGMARQPQQSYAAGLGLTEAQLEALCEELSSSRDQEIELVRELSREGKGQRGY